MRLRSKIVAALGGSVLVLTGPPALSEPAQPPDVLTQQYQAHRVYDSLPQSLVTRLAGHWFDAATGKLTVAVSSEADAQAARSAGADAKVVARTKKDLDQLLAQVSNPGVPGVYSWGIDVQANTVQVTVNTATSTAATDAFVAKVQALGVQVVKTKSQQRQQSGTIHTGDPWWPGSESNCSVGFPVTDSAGAKHFLTAGHCTNDVNQAAYGQSGQSNKIGTSNVGGTHSVNAREGDMGVVAVTEPGWDLSASVNTWGQPALTVTGSAEAMVGDRVCHSGNTSHWQCGVVKYTHKAVDYGGGLVIEDLTWTTACSLGGDSGGGWLLNDKATGLHDGGPSQCVQNPSDDDLSIFQPVGEALRKWGLTLVTGSGDTEPPTAPGNLRATGTTADSVSLAWDAATDNTGVTGYDVLSGSTVATSVAGTTATVTGLAPDTSHTFTVQARDAAGNASTPSSPVTVRTSPGGRTFSNSTDYPIQDFKQLYSPISVQLTGQAQPITTSITIQHTCLEDLGITLFDPNGKAYPLKYSGGYTCTRWSGPKTFTVATVSSPAGGKWQLRVTDYGPGDTGVLDTWSLTL